MWGRRLARVIEGRAEQAQTKAAVSNTQGQEPIRLYNLGFAPALGIKWKIMRMLNT